ncbi:MAG: hypothetical protein ABJC12_09345 [Saprospiraceae bacterium]
MHLRIFTLPIQGKDTWRQSKTGWTIINFSTEILNIPTLVILFIGIYYCIKERSLFFAKPVYFYIPLLVLFMYFFYILNVIREGHDYYLLPFYPVFILPIILALSKLPVLEGFREDIYCNPDPCYACCMLA